MGFNKITAAEAAALIQNGDTIGLSGFTPAGVPKSVPAEIARKAEKEHAEGKEFKINILTGASTGQSCDGMLANAHAIKFRALTPRTKTSVRMSTIMRFRIPTSTFPIWPLKSAKVISDK